MSERSAYSKPDKKKDVRQSMIQSILNESDNEEDLKPYDQYGQIYTDISGNDLANFKQKRNYDQTLPKITSKLSPMGKPNKNVNTSQIIQNSMDRQLVALREIDKSQGHQGFMDISGISGSNFGPANLDPSMMF
jgi:hypothetical protein